MKILFMAFSLLAFNALAEDSLVDMKRKTTEHIDMKMSRLEESKACITNAQTKDTFKACKKNMKQYKQSMQDHSKMKHNKSM